MQYYYTINTPSVIGETLDGESIIVDLDSGAYYSLRGVGAAIWEALEAWPGEEELVRHLCRSYAGNPDEIAEEVRRFLDLLLKERLIRREGERPSGAGALVGTEAEGAARPEFTQPGLEKYTDMADLLLLDPIHEVDKAAGWPTPGAK